MVAQQYVSFPQVNHSIVAISQISDLTSQKCKRFEKQKVEALEVRTISRH